MGGNDTEAGISPLTVDVTCRLLVQHLVAQYILRSFRCLTPIVCVQNMYNLAYRHDDELIDMLADEGIAYVPFFPLGGFSPLQSSALSTVAARLDATPMSVALAWLLQRSPNILLIPGTSSTEHLRENVAGARLSLSDEELAELNKIGH